MPPFDLNAFFQGYVAAFNRSLGAAVDAQGIRAHFTDCFIGAGPTAVSCGKNDDSFAETLHEGYAFYKSTGMKRIALRDVQTKPIDDHHQMAKVLYHADYEKKDGSPVSIDFDVTYILHLTIDGPLIFTFIAGDEMALYRKHGLMAEDSAPPA